MVEASLWLRNSERITRLGATPDRVLIPTLELLLHIQSLTTLSIHDTLYNEST